MEGPQKIASMPQEWRDRFNAIAADMESMVIENRQNEEHIKQIQKEIEDEEAAILEFTQNYKDTSPVGQQFLRGETERQQKYLTRMRVLIAEIEQAMQRTEAMRLAKLEGFEKLKKSYASSVSKIN